jgi:hypothetical protein
MSKFTAFLDRLGKAVLYPDTAEFISKYPERKTKDIIRVLSEKVPEIDWVSIADDFEDDD